jgi:hypothetical protein
MVQRSGFLASRKLDESIKPIMFGSEWRVVMMWGEKNLNDRMDTAIQRQLLQFDCPHFLDLRQLPDFLQHWFRRWRVHLHH